MSTSTHSRLAIGGVGALVLVLLLLGFVTTTPARAATLPSGFSEQTVFSGLTLPTAVRFAPDGRVFVAEKSGLIKVFDSLNDPKPTTFADLRTNVHNFWDRGLLGIALDPNFATNPYVYVLYAHDAAIGGTAPRWGTPGSSSDGCPNPPGATSDGCVVSGRLSRLRAAGSVMTGSEQVLIEDWCQQYPSHSVGDLAFGPDGALYVSGGDGASFTYADYGQGGGSRGSPPPTPKNPCGDPPAGSGGTQTPPTAEGGALRSQSLRRPSGQPVLLNGSILRLDPATGLGLPDNPGASSSDANARRIIAYGMRNPFRFAVRPGTSEIWLGDVGWESSEELDRIVDPKDSTVENFGWPCYEGVDRQPGYESANLDICRNLYGQANAVTSPYYTYRHSAQVVPGETCPTGSSSVTGLAFQSSSGDPYPTDYGGALFFADYSRGCIWVMQRGGNGLPSPDNIAPFVAGAASPVDLQIGPGGELYYVDLDGGTIRRVNYTEGNQPPTALAEATPTSGDPPLNVSFDATGSSDPDPGDTLSYAWDLNGDGAYDDSTSATPTYTYASAGTYTPSVKVTDNHGASSTASVMVSTAAPKPRITAPSPSRQWAVGDRVDFAGSATDSQGAPMAPSALSWSLVLHHCPSNCHKHPLQDFPGVASGSFDAPDHDYPSYLELSLTATDSRNVEGKTSVRLDPRTVGITLQGSPSGLQAVLNSGAAPTPFTRTVIAGSSNSLSAPSPQIGQGMRWEFDSWSDGGAQTHNITADDTATYTARYQGSCLDIASAPTGCSVPAPFPAPTVADTVAPMVTRYGLTNTRFVVDGAKTPTTGLAARTKQQKRGTTFQYSLSEPATVKIVIARGRSGRRKGNRCVVPGRSVRKAKKCIRLYVRGTLTRTSHQGANSVAFSGDIGSTALPPGNYQATLTATDKARNTSKPKSITFSVVKRQSTTKRRSR